MSGIDIDQEGASQQESPHFFVYGGWCPNLSGLNLRSYDNKEEIKERNFEDVREDGIEAEKVEVCYQYENGLIKSILCGIPECCFVKAIIEWEAERKGLFLLKCFFSADPNGNVPTDLDDEQKNILCQNVIYRLIKDVHHTHTHHEEDEADNLLSLYFLGIDSDENLGTEAQIKIAKDIYHQYSNQKPKMYMSNIKELLEDRDETKASRLEEAIKILFLGIGEATFGIAFLGEHGNKLFTEPQIMREHIKMESSMRSLEVLKGKYTFEFMKKNRTNFNINEAIGQISKGVTDALLEASKR